MPTGGGVEDVELVTPIEYLAHQAAGDVFALPHTVDGPSRSIVEAVVRILDGRAHAMGVVAPGQAFDAASFLSALPALQWALDPGE